MINRIFELAKQADLIQWDTLPSGAITPDHDSVVKAKRFAELIIADVLELTEPNPGNGPYGDNEDYALQCVQRDIKEHFGIK